MHKRLPIVALAAVIAGCASLGSFSSIVQPPRFERARDERPEIRLLSPSTQRPLGGAAVRMWTKVTNPNPFGFTLSTLDGTLYLDDVRAASSEFPLGLPLAARGETVIPIELSIDFSELPGLSGVVRSAIARQPIAFRVEGTIGVDAGRLGMPIFGPMTLASGTFE